MEWVIDLVEAGGLLGLAAAILLENVFPPIPSEVVLPLAGVAVGRGQLLFSGAVLAATAGSVAGALVLYAVARLGGRPLLLRWSGVLRLDRAQLDRADAWFDRHGAWFVLLGRLVPGVRSVVSVPAGLSEMPLPKFVGLTALGSAVWNAALIGAGVALGEHHDVVGQAIGPVSTAAMAAVAVGVVALLLRARRRA